MVKAEPFPLTGRMPILHFIFNCKQLLNHHKTLSRLIAKKVGLSPLILIILDFVITDFGQFLEPPLIYSDRVPLPELN